MQVDPIHQFQIKNLLPMVNVGGHAINFTNSCSCSSSSAPFRRC
jgi:hypothetical protein